MSSHQGPRQLDGTNRSVAVVIAHGASAHAKEDEDDAVTLTLADIDEFEYERAAGKLLCSCDHHDRIPKVRGRRRERVPERSPYSLPLIRVPDHSSSLRTGRVPDATVHPCAEVHHGEWDRMRPLQPRARVGRRGRHPSGYGRAVHPLRHIASLSAAARSEYEEE